MRMQYQGALSKIGQFLRIVLIDDPLLKLLCAALAFLMWIYIDGELTSQKEYELALKPSDIARTDSLEIAATNTMPKFKVTVRGARRQIEFWPREGLRFKRKLLDNAHSGRNAVSVAVSDVEAESFTVVSVEPVDPDGAFVDFVSTATAIKNVRVRTRNSPRAEFLVGQPSSTPMRVRVKGAADDLALINEVWTEEVDLNGVEQAIHQDVPISEKMDIGDRIIKIQCDEKVHVTIPIDPVKATLVQTLDVWARVPPGLAMRVDPQ
ncbi:MAG: YbbR-like domain-containing protein, partial [Planctomycetota bacterium]